MDPAAMSFVCFVELIQLMAVPVMEENNDASKPTLLVL